MIKTRPLFDTVHLPFLVYEDLRHLSADERLARPPASVDDLLAWCGAHRDLVTEALCTHGAILFRGFGVDTEDTLARFAAVHAADGLLDYTDGTSPRTKLTNDGVYTSTDYPSDQFISLHNELSYSHRWPARLFFACKTAPRQGGETPIADSRRILAGLRPSTADLFIRKGVRYVRYLHGGGGVGLSWMQSFETEDRRTAERYCDEGGVDYEWTARGGLRMLITRSAVTRHPATGETVWFNQADQFHPTEMDAETRKSLLAVVDESELPKNVRFGDDTPIDVDLLEEIRGVTRKETVAFPWRRGDLLMVDNLLASHGRNPYEGPRRILVAMG